MSVEDGLTFNTVSFTDVDNHQGLFYRLRAYHAPPRSCHGYGMFMTDNDAYSKGNNSTYDNLLRGDGSEYGRLVSSLDQLWIEFHLGNYSS